MTILSPISKTTSSSGGSAHPDQISDKNYSYSDTFYRYIQAGSVRSASHVAPLVLRELSPRSVLDVGCGAGAWLSVYGNLDSLPPWFTTIAMCALPARPSTRSRR